MAVFISAIYKLFSSALSSFIVTEKTKSSREMISQIIEEWEHLFAKDVNLILLKCYLKLVANQSKCFFFSFIYFILNYSIFSIFVRIQS